MQLTYRGSKYESNTPTVETTAGETGKYRGLDWRFRNFKKAPVQQASLDLKYRGVAYRTSDRPDVNDAVANETAVVAAPLAESVKATGLSTENRARTRMTQQHHLIKNRQQTLLSRSAAEAGFTHLSDYWNHIQGDIHPTFRRNYERSHVALS
ncbi:DUF4278 domain-containing protein [Trichocoleus sp. FACHB-591]|uniref:DUF4278 domain-containing protein n=1 Tax=Trichocoleus sp. FACHB-591 TaxID=2692872 RepID=UPI0016843945|nr:DUF4278 domain-containing protein [Trichocoleus sp. FACHB-591]MBD2094048.1 DUF4278 domain-containing protein [Trichocoleus sp. FACHB-591]